MDKKLLVVAVGVALSGFMQTALAETYSYTGSNTWLHTVDTTTTGATGTITFNDWGYTGPTGVGVNDFQVGSGFNSSSVGQVQTVTTVAPDWLTPDPTRNVKPYIGFTTYTNANMDGNVNFYKMAYTTPTSTFNNMQIDTAGNYYVPKANMSFGFYDDFLYNNGITVQNVDTDLNFQPYAISDAKGWCGSVLTSDPNSLEVMAGQVTFDFAFDAYFTDSTPETSSPATQIVPGFVMRSYGDYYVNVTNVGSGYNMNFEGHAVGNNTNPTTVVAGVGGSLDSAFQNKVSFLGAGVVPLGAWVFNPGTQDVTVADDQTYVPGTQAGDVRETDGATWHANDFAGFAFLLRADAGRVVTYINPEGWSDYTVVPVPAAVWLFGSGLLGLAGLARRKKK
ncbi:MAG: VPLPA-CTERM sorting domain-containing protein [Sulfuricaulis sp.]|uniref:VPLPA-CTERM sorting domain-containing protein n=1 Tax=Sulfuricaulis sp. TaxID=2003553 RepID=UPI0025D098A5|nr:VPLPA-CTERM sorting domain-containing protein [Sulfuricaulis sp.]MCR4347286.1 VPLPA-CTERM sorting domain-containing protein [Sulfuricaulis sp.]